MLVIDSKLEARAGSKQRSVGKGVRTPRYFLLATMLPSSASNPSASLPILVPRTQKDRARG
eukprot:3941604-Rhodomonas_salina.1